MFERKRLALASLVLALSTACSSAPSEPQLLEQLIVEPASPTLSAAGDSVILQVMKRDADGEKTIGCESPRWRSQDEQVAVVRGNGRVIAKGLGIAAIVASCGTAQAAASVQVGNTAGSLKAFPEAEGHGAEALNRCNRKAMRVVKVTTLADAGPGSFRDAVAQANGNSLTVVTFDVAGYIDLSAKVEIRKGCLYVAGQTAPGDGITLRRRGFEVRNEAHDVVIRYLRVRPGDSGAKGPVPVNVRAVRNMVLDHVSVSWSNEKLIHIARLQIQSSGPISRLTIQRSLVAEPFARVPVGLTITGLPKNWEGSTPPGWTEMSDMSIHHNLFASVHHRNPNVTAMGVEVVNNLVYNWMMDAGKGVHGAKADWVNNYLKPGPMFDSWRYELGYRCEDASDLSTHRPSLYFAGNIGPRNSDPAANPWSGESRMVGCYNDRDGTPLDPSWKRDSRLPQPVYPVRLQPAEAVYGDVLADVGSNRGLRCDGSWRSRLDDVDRRILDDVRGGRGPSQAPANEGELGGFPSLSTGSTCPDSDGDGLPDEYESRHGFDKNNADDGWRDWDGDGYTNVEEFLNGSRPT